MKKETTIQPILDTPPARRDTGASTIAQPARPVSYTRKIVRLTFERVGARAGIVCVAILVLLAVFAPFLANSHPFLIKEEGRWRSPLLQFLTPADVALQVTFWTAAVLYFVGRWSVGKRVIILVSVTAIAIVVSLIAVHPQKPVVYNAYRIAIKKGKITEAHYPLIHYSPEDHQRDIPDERLQPPSGAHPMGTTADRADLASNMIHASRIALSIGFVATGVAVFLGVLMGGLMGYLGGWIDLIGMRLVEIFEAIPTLLLLMAFAAMFQSSPESALYIMMVIIGIFSAFTYAEFVRAEFLSLRNRDFVHAARAAGLRLPSILFRHMLPNGMTPVIVNASFGVASAILIESTLSFLGIGLQTEASWGGLLNQATGAGTGILWWLAIYPGLAIFLTVFSYNLIGEALRDALDPRLNKME